MQCNSSGQNLLRTSCKSIMEFAVTFVRTSAVPGISLAGGSFLVGTFIPEVVDSEGGNAAK